MSSLNRIVTLPQPPIRPGDGHKGTFGSVLIIAGSEGMSGAACLAGYGALRGGAGLVTLGIPNCIAAIVAAVQPSWLTRPLPDVCSDVGFGRLSELAIPTLDRALVKQTAVAIGPGLGQSADVRAVVRHVNQQCAVPLVIDADGLNAFSGEPETLVRRDHSASRIVTPHPGEFSRLTGIDVQTIQANREQVAAEFAAKHDVIVLLKGPQSVITDGTQLAINTTGNSGMATGGSGDILTGLIASLVAQGLTPFAAAHLGAHLHGLAGDIGADQDSQRSLIADDIHRFLGKAWQIYLDG